MPDSICSLELDYTSKRYDRSSSALEQLYENNWFSPGDVMFNQKYMERYFTIVGEICKDPYTTLKAMDSQTHIHRSTISRNIIELYKERCLFGPWLSMNPHENYSQYVYVMNFSDPHTVFEGLKTFPYVRYHAHTFGEWNTLVITERLLDLSELKGFQSAIVRREKGFTYTPTVTYITWDESWRMVKEGLEIIKLKKKDNNGTLPELCWEKKDWNLYNAFKGNVRQRALPVLKKLGIRYECYIQWKNEILNHCGIHTEFYPQPVQRYTNHCLLLKSRYIESVEELFSLFPTTPVFVEMTDCVLVYVKMTSDDTQNLIDLVYDMKDAGIIEDANYAVVFNEHRS